MLRVRAPDPVNTAKSLLDLVGVPWEVVIDHQVPALKVNTLASGVVGDQHHQVSVLHEPLDDFPAFFPRHAAMDDFNILGFAKTGSDFIG